MNTFSATVRSGNRRGSWWTTAMPSARAWAGPVDLDRLAVEPDRPAVGLMDAGEDLDERALAGAVLADERMDLARHEVERHVVQRLGRARTASRCRAARRAAAVATAGPAVTAGLACAGSSAARLATRRPPARRSRTSMPRPVERLDHRRRGALRRSGPRAIWSVRQNVANAARSHFVWSTIAMTSRAAATIERLIWASSSVASARPDSRVKPAAPRNAFWTLIRLNTPSPSWPTTDSASQRTRPPGISDGDPGMTGELRGDPQAVGDDGQLAPAAARLEVPGDGQRGGARVHRDALAVVDERRAGRADPALLVGLEPLADVEGELGPARGRRRSPRRGSGSGGARPRGRGGPCGS